MQSNLGTKQSSRFTKRRGVRFGGAFLALALMAGLLGACELAPVPGTSHSPSGYVDVVTGGADSVRVQGWTSDWDTRNPIDIVVLINGVWAPGVFTANLPRTDVAARYGRGANFGYDVTLPAPAGALSVCVVALNVLRGQNTILGCATTTATTPTIPTTTIPTTTTTTSLVPVALTPVIDLVDPAYGPIEGGSRIILTGTGFTGATSLTIRGVEATGLVVDSATEVHAFTPALPAGPADIFLTTPGGTTDAPGIVDYTYIDCSVRGPGADLRGCNLTELDLSGLDLSGANLTGADLTRSYLANINLNLANLTDTIFDTSNMTNGILTNTVLDGTDFVDMDMTGVDLSNGAFTYGRLRGSNLTRTDLRGTNLTDVDLFGSTWFDTTCPNGSVSSVECPRT